MYILSKFHSNDKRLYYDLLKMNIECSLIYKLPPSYSYSLKYRFSEELRFQEIECPYPYLNNESIHLRE